MIKALRFDQKTGKPIVRIENWTMTPSFTGLTASLYGNVYGHPRLPEGVQAYTSPIVALDEPGSRCETMNTVYELGAKWAPPKEIA